VRVTGQFAPLMGALIGSLGGAIYWLGMQVWPSSVRDPVHGIDCPAPARMAVGSGSAASGLEPGCCACSSSTTRDGAVGGELRSAVPANVPLGFIMVCGYAASFALLVSVTRCARQVRAYLERRGLGLAAVDRIRAGRPAGHSRLIGLAAAILAGPGNPGISQFKRAGVRTIR